MTTTTIYQNASKCQVLRRLHHGTFWCDCLLSEVKKGDCFRLLRHARARQPATSSPAGVSPSDPQFGYYAADNGFIDTATGLHGVRVDWAAVRPTHEQEILKVDTAPKSPTLVRLTELVAQAPTCCTAHFASTLHELASEVAQMVASSEKVVDYDDNSFVMLDSYAGGGCATGAWSKLSLRFYAPDGSSTVRHYTESPPEAAPESPTEFTVVCSGVHWQ